MNPSTAAAIKARRERGIPVAPLQDAFHRSGLTSGQLAFRMGWTRKRRSVWRNGRVRPRPNPITVADSTRVLRRLGLVSYRSRGYLKTQDFMTYGMAERFARALDVDPIDVGL